MTTYLLRINLDVEIKELSDSLRLKTAFLTLRRLIRPDVKIVILSHRGRPKKSDSRLSLKPIVRLLSRQLRKEILFLDRFDFRMLRRKIQDAPAGSILALENLRFLRAETENDKGLAKKLAGLGDIYINDDFASSHRKNASIVGIPQFLPSFPGPNLQNEIRHLSKIIHSPRHPFILIIGGVKVDDKIGVIKNLLPLADKILLGGGSANTFLKSQGIDIRNSVFDPKMVGVAKTLLNSTAGKRKIMLPIDWQIEKEQILDIGPKTIRQYTNFILTAKNIVWSGPMGYIETIRFRQGSAAIARAIARSGAFSIVGGGDTTSFIANLKLHNKISFLSTGGGAMLYFLSGRELPGLKALEKSRRQHANFKIKPLWFND